MEGVTEYSAHGKPGDDTQGVVLRVTWHGQMPPEALTTIGEWLERQDDGPDPAVYYQAAPAVDPTFSWAAWQLGRWELRRGRFVEAAEALEEAMRHAPDHAPTFYLASQAYAGLGDDENALRCAEAALALNPLNAAAAVQRLRSLAALERWIEIAHTPSSLRVDQAPEMLLWRALAAVYLGNTEEAREACARLPEGTRRRRRETVRRIERFLASSTRERSDDGNDEASASARR